MKITKIQTYLIEYEKTTDGISGTETQIVATYGVIGKTQHVIVKVSTDEGLYGVGEAMNFYIRSPARRHLRPKETGSTVVQVIKEILSPAIIGEDPLNVNKIYRTMENWVSGHRSAKAAIDMACYDIAGKYCNLPLYSFLGGAFRTEAPGLGGVPLGKPEEMAKKGREWIDKGWCGFQIKLGGFTPNPDLDVERVRKVRESVGEDAIILGDFNQAYSPDQAIRVLRRMERYNIYAEQPTPSYDLKGLAKVANSITLPVVADEALSNGQPIRNLIEIIQSSAASVIKLKCMPLGGISVQRKIIEIAREYEIPLITDADGPCTRVNDSALAHVTALLNDDIFFPTSIGATSLYLSPDIVNKGGLTVKAGVVHIPDGPGLGVELNMSLLREV